MSIVTAVAVVTVIGLLGAAILVVAAHFMQKPLSRARR